MILARTATKSKTLAKTAYMWGLTLLAFTCGSSVVMAEDSDTRDATFVGVFNNSGITASAPATSSSVKRFFPTMDAATYATLKSQAASAASVSKPGGGLAPFRRGTTLKTLNISFPGLDRPGSADQGFIYTPPDVNIASGQSQIMEVTNNHVACYDFFGNVLANNPASMFFMYTRQLFTDPRVVYDTIWNRWIVTEVAFPENPTTMIFFLAVSQSSDCTGVFNVYTTNQPLAPNDFYDYPQVGYDQDAILVTFNVFNGPPKYGEIDFWAKARVYNGLGLQVPFINGYSTSGTLTPNTGRDKNGTTIVLQNVIGTNQLNLIELTNTSKNNPGTSTVTITTPEVCGVPRSANQPGTGATLDTLDGRFQAPGTQMSISSGNFVWNAQTCGLFGFPIPRVLQIDINANTVVRDDLVFSSGTSDDFNPSLAVNDFGDVLVNWSSTDAPAVLNAGALYASRSDGGSFNAPAQCFQSTTSYSGFRWGDTSGTSVDYTDPSQQTWWVGNETIENASDWGTNICQVSRP
jgi:hypothetical protein